MDRLGEIILRQITGTSETIIYVCMFLSRNRLQYCVAHAYDHTAVVYV